MHNYEQAKLILIKKIFISVRKINVLKKVKNERTTINNRHQRKR
jgi:hypothetical protein